MLIVFVGIGFLAQMIDGALGMGFGVTSNAFLLCFGVTPAAAGASIHISKIFTSGFSSFKSLRKKDINIKLFKSLVFPGVLGGILGAFLLSIVSIERAKPLIAIYLFFLSFFIINKAFRKFEEENVHNHFYKIIFLKKHLDNLLGCFRCKKEIKNNLFIRVLGGIGGFLDSFGGGGWGPLVTSTLISKKHNPNRTIGAAVSADFFVNLSASITFLIMLKFLASWYSLFGLLLGGALAAPMASVLRHRTAPRSLMLFIGLTILAISIFVFMTSI